MENEIKKCKVKIPYPEYRDDVLHPCIRYIEEGYCGHQWWMVMSPFYAENDAIENPILFYGDSESEKIPPLEWQFATVVKETPACGYNSDPMLYFDNGKLRVLWREFRTERTLKAGYNSAIYAITYDSDFRKQSEIFVCGESSATELSDLSPIIIKKGDEWALYTMYVHLEHSFFKRGIVKIARIFGKKGSAHKTIGLRFRKACSLTRFKEVESIIFPFDGNIEGLLPWHFDLIFYKNRWFMLLFCHGEQNIRLAELCEKRIHVFSEPLLGKTVIDTYKPTGVVVDDNLYLYYTDRVNPEDTKQHLLSQCKINLEEYLEKFVINN